MNSVTDVSRSTPVPYEAPQLRILGTVPEFTEWNHTCYPIAGGKTWGHWDATWQIPITSNCSV